MRKLRTYLSLWYRKMFGVLTLEECKSEGLTLMYNVYGDAINVRGCRSIWMDGSGHLYRCESLVKEAEF